MRGRKGYMSAINYNRRSALVRNGRASWVPVRTTLSEALALAGL